MYDDTFEHHGIKGQRWGVRRYQNADGSLTPRGRKKYSKEFKKHMIKGDEDLKKDIDRLQVNSWNKAADRMNNGGIKKFNEAQEKKYGSKYEDRDGYMDDYQKLWNKELNKELSKALNEYARNNKHYRKAYEVSKKHNLGKEASSATLRKNASMLNEAFNEKR